MRIEVRSDSVLVDGYVNAVGRDSKPIVTNAGRVVEQIEPRAFERALQNADEVLFLLDHDKNKRLTSTKDEETQLFEDNIGLRAIAVIRDPEVIEKAKLGLLKGWSFGMHVNEDKIESRADDIPRRIVKSLDLYEVSIIDERMNPCYTGTSIEQRAEKEVEIEQRANSFKAVTVVETQKIDYSDYENRIKALHQA